MSPIRILWESDRAEKQEFFWSHISIPLMAEIFPILPKRRVVEFISSKLKQYLHFGGNINHCTETFTTKINSKKICSYFSKEEVAVMALRKQRQSHIEYFKGLWSRNKLGDRYKLLIVFSICSSQPHCIGVKTKLDSWCPVYTRAKNDGDDEKGWSNYLTATLTRLTIHPIIFC